MHSSNVEDNLIDIVGGNRSCLGHCSLEHDHHTMPGELLIMVLRRLMMV